MPTSSIDTFFACTIIVAAALIATAFLTSTMQTRIDNTQDINKQNYLKAIADHMVTNPGTPVDWGKSSLVPGNFGLAANPSTTPFELDMDKITRLNSVNNYSISYFDMQKAAKLNNLALGVRFSQYMSINIQQTSSSASGGETAFTFAVSTIINSKPATAALNCYAMANNYLSNVTSELPNGVGDFTVQIPTAEIDNALLVMFARASFDDRITSYAIYNFADSSQETASSSNVLTLNPLNYTVNVNVNLSGATVQNARVFSYGYEQGISSFDGAQLSIPKIIDISPLIIVVSGLDGSAYFQQWVAYPQIPLRAGSSFAGSEQNVFSYVVTVNGVLYKAELSFGDVNP
jgi:hypothetical protein